MTAQNLRKKCWRQLPDVLGTFREGTAENGGQTG